MQSRSRSLLAFVHGFFLIFLLSPLRAQGPRVVVTNIGDRDLKRSAHRLRIPVAQLKHARQALQQATSLSEHSDPPELWQLGQLAQLWIQLDRSRAASAIDSIFEELRNSASSASDASFYQQSSSVAQGLLSTLAQFDLQKAQQLAQQWPAPAPSLGESAQNAFKSFRKGFDGICVNRLAAEDPEQLLSVLSGSQSQPGYSMRSQAAAQMISRGRRDQALKIIDDGIAQFAQGNSDNNSFQDFAQFVQQLSWSAPERFENAFALMLSHVNDPPQSGEQPLRMQVGIQTLELTPRENTLLNVFRGMGGHPEMSARALEAIPQLRAKLAQVGGLDYFLNPNQWQENLKSAAASSDRAMQEWAFQFRGKASKNPSLLQEKLSEFPDPGAQVSALIMLAQQSAYEDPDLSSRALELARSLVGQVESLERRAQLIQNLTQAYQNLEGEVDGAFLKEGFALVDQLRKKEKAELKHNQPRGHGPGDQLEIILFQQWARVDFDSAVGRVNSSADDKFRFRALLAIAQALAYW